MPRCLECWFRGACIAVALTFSGTSAAVAQQAPVEPPAQPGLIDQARDAAAKAREITEKAAKTFAETLQGQSVVVGVTQTTPKLDLLYHSASETGAGRVESYSGDPSTGYLVSFESAAKESYLPLDDAGVWVGTWGFRFTTTYGNFALRQTLQKNAGGKGGGGEVEGNFLGFAVPVMFNIIRNSDSVPFAIGWGMGLGKAFVRYEAPLRYAVDGTDYNLHVQSDGYYARNMIFAGWDIRVWNFLFRWQVYEMHNGEAYARFHGKRVVTFSDEFTLDIKTLAYVYNF
jgi:hypothetical protein